MFKTDESFNKISTRWERALMMIHEKNEGNKNGLGHGMTEDQVIQALYSGKQVIENNCKEIYKLNKERRVLTVKTPYIINLDDFNLLGFERLFYLFDKKNYSIYKEKPKLVWYDMCLGECESNCIDDANTIFYFIKRCGRVYITTLETEDYNTDTFIGAFETISQAKEACHKHYGGLPIENN